MEKKDDLGPGSYALSHNIIGKKSVASSAFNSRSTKSHIEDIVKDKMKLHEANATEPSAIKELLDDVRLEERNKVEEKKYVKESSKNGRRSPIFMSKLDRLPKIESEKVGPGSYNLDSSEKKEKKIRVKTDYRICQSR